MLDVKRLRLLWELRTRGTIAEVARALNFTPSAVSQQLNLLEREAGVRLLRKAGRSVELTVAGEALADEAEVILAQLEHAGAALARTQTSISGRLRIAVFQTAVLTLIPGVLRRLRIEHPHLRVEVVQYETERGLYETWARSFDLVVAEQYPGHAAPHFAQLDRVALLNDTIQLGLPPAEAAPEEFHGITRLEQTADLPWVMEPHPAASRHWAEQACRIAGFEPDVRYETADLQAHIRLVESGNAVALLPGLVHGRNGARVRLVGLPGAPRRTIFTATRASSADYPALEVLRSALTDEALSLTENER